MSKDQRFGPRLTEDRPVDDEIRKALGSKPANPELVEGQSEQARRIEELVAYKTELEDKWHAAEAHITQLESDLESKAAADRKVIRDMMDEHLRQRARIATLEQALREAREVIEQAQADYDDVEDQGNLQASLDRIDAALPKEIP